MLPGVSIGLLGLFAVLPLLSAVRDATLFTLTLMLTSVASNKTPSTGVVDLPRWVNWNLTGGFTGYVDFGHAAWFGIGAYTTAILMSLQTNAPQVGWKSRPRPPS